MRKQKMREREINGRNSRYLDKKKNNDLVSFRYYKTLDLENNKAIDLKWE